MPRIRLMTDPPRELDLEALVGAGGCGAVWRIKGGGVCKILTAPMAAIEMDGLELIQRWRQNKAVRLPQLDQKTLPPKDVICLKCTPPDLIPRISPDEALVGYVLEAVAGIPLAEAALGHGFTFATAWKTILQSAETLVDLHRDHIAHADIKPGNWLLAGETLWLIDFGACTQALLDDRPGLSRWRLVTEGWSLDPWRDGPGLAADVAALAATWAFVFTGRSDASGLKIIAEGKLGFSAACRQRFPAEDRDWAGLWTILDQMSGPGPRPALDQVQDLLAAWYQGTVPSFLDLVSTVTTRPGLKPGQPVEG